MKKFLVFCKFCLTFIICNICYVNFAIAKNNENNFNKEIFVSKINNIKYKIYTAIQKEYYKYNKNYPVLYVLDADPLFLQVRDIVLKNKKNIIIVGIGYEDNKTDKNTNKQDLNFFRLNRMRDYLPMKLSKSFERYEKKGYSKEAEYSGKASEFADFLKKELIPYINKKYRTTKKNTLYGHSLGGFFATWIMIKDPLIFQKYLISSPALWYEDGYIYNFFDNINKKVKLKAFFSIGEKELVEKYDSSKARYIHLGRFEGFYSKIRRYKNIDSRKIVFENKNHKTVIEPALKQGIDFLFD